MNKEKLSKELDGIIDMINKTNSRIKEINKEIYASKLKVPNRFLQRKYDLDYGWITGERLNTEFKILEDRVNKLERKKNK
ncbi:MAG: hypothetical protein KKD77_21885 [Gammaproteobacteria bacterium]|nr:hypothetical protein [Gammaproteobacteria bacterium]